MLTKVQKVELWVDIDPACKKLDEVVEYFKAKQEVEMIDWPASKFKDFLVKEMRGGHKNVMNKKDGFLLTTESNVAVLRRQAEKLMNKSLNLHQYKNSTIAHFNMKPNLLRSEIYRMFRDEDGNALTALTEDQHFADVFNYIFCLHAESIANFASIALNVDKRCYRGGVVNGGKRIFVTVTDNVPIRILGTVANNVITIGDGNQHTIDLSRVSKKDAATKIEEYLY